MGVVYSGNDMHRCPNCKISMKKSKWLFNSDGGDCGVILIAPCCGEKYPKSSLL